MKLILLLVIVIAAVSFARAADAPPARPTVYAWFPAKFGTWNTSSLRWDLLTHLCYRSVVLRADGSLDEPLGRAADPAIANLVKTAHQHNVKVTVLVWCNNANDSDGYLANAPQQAADNLLAYVRAHRLDGINIDDETFRETNQLTRSPNRPLATAFFQILRRTFNAADPKLHISYAAPPVISSKDRFGASWLDLAAIAPEVDAIFPMGYELNPPSIGWSTHSAPLAGGGKAPTTTTRDYQTMLDDYIAAIGPANRHKLLPGFSLTTGGYEFRTRTIQPLSPTLGKGTPKTLQECEQATARHGRRWHDLQACPWYVYPDGDAFIQGWYSDLEALQARMRWTRQQNLSGIALWVLDGQSDPPTLWSALEALR